MYPQCGANGQKSLQNNLFCDDKKSEQLTGYFISGDKATGA
jgi:hypothetical protein